MGFFLKAPVSEEQVNRIRALAKTLRDDPKKGKHVEQMVQVSSDTISMILEYLFIEPLNRVNAGMLTKKGASMGIKTGLSMFSKIAKSSFAGFSDQQLVSFADWLVEGIESD